MKEGLMWFIVVAVLGTIIPSKGWLAVFGLVVFFLGCLIQHISDKKKEYEKRQRGELPATPPPSNPISQHDHFGFFVVLFLIAGAFYLLIYGAGHGSDFCYYFLGGICMLLVFGGLISDLFQDLSKRIGPHGDHKTHK